ncbi:MAG: hypothetical protein Fur003_4330 [Candidatus Dojkabacteria bacterium]
MPTTPTSDTAPTTTSVNTPNSTITPPVADPASGVTAPKKGSGFKKGCLIALGIVVIMIILAIIGVYKLYLIGREELERLQDEQTNSFTNDEKENNNDNTEGDLDFADGDELPPYNLNFAAEMVLKQRALDQNDGFSTNVNGIGNPSYSYSILYRSDMGTVQRDIATAILATNDKSIEMGMLYFPSTTKQYTDMTCEELVEDIYSKLDINKLSTKDALVNGELWERVEYTFTNNGKSYHGIDQCLDREEARLLNFIVVKASEWSKNGADYVAVMNDVYVSESADLW